MFFVHKKCKEPQALEAQVPQPASLFFGSQSSAPLRFAARATALLMTWYVTAPSVGAAVTGRRSEERTGHTRKLTTSEMNNILGAQGGHGGAPLHSLSNGPDGGTAYPWEGESGGANTGNGNKLTELNLVGWKALGRQVGGVIFAVPQFRGKSQQRVGT